MSTQQSKVSILICTYNRADTLKRCLDSVAQIASDKLLYEVVVINNNSTDHTNDTCQNFSTSNPDVSFRMVVETNVGYAFVRNRAVAEAQFDLLAFIDDDATVLPNYVENIIKAFTAWPEYSSAGGKIIISFEEGNEPKFLSKYLNPFSKVDFGEVTKEFPHAFEVKCPPGCNMIIRKEAFDKYGDFENANWRGEDKHMFKKLRMNNEKILYIHDVVVYHHQSKERCQWDNLMKLGYYNGKSISMSLHDEGFAKWLVVLAERIFKFGAALTIGAFFFITFRPTKARYLISYLYNMLTGYIAGKNFNSTGN